MTTAMICYLFLVFITVKSCYCQYNSWYHRQESRPSGFSWKDCVPDDSDRILSFDSLSLDSYPLRWGSQVGISASVRLHEDISDDLISVTSFGPMPLTLNTPLPCINNEFGSCTKPLCNVIESEDILCNFIKRGRNNSSHSRHEDPSCSCPITSGQYSGYNIQMKIPDIPPILRFFASVRIE